MSQQKEYIPAGTMILEQGTEGDAAYMIESGTIEVYFRDPDGHHITLAELGPGALVGEMAAVLGGRRTASAKAGTDAVLVPIAAPAEKSNPVSSQMYNFIMWLVSERMKDTSMKIEQHTRHNQGKAAH